MNRRRSACGTTVALAAALALGASLVSPVGAQTQGPNTPSTVVDDPSTGTLAWTGPQQAAVSDDAPAFAGAPTAELTHYLKATGLGFALPVGAVIEGIEVDVERKGFAFDAAVRIVKGGAIGATDRSLPGDWAALVDVIVTYGGSNDLWGEAWTAADINAADFGFAMSVLVADSIALVDAISITVFYNTLCGNGVIDVNEQCDDGNFADGDCCSSTCQLDVVGTPCPDATICNGAETCDGAGGCDPGAPLDCDDGSLCTADSCHPVTGCVNDGSPVAGCRTAAKSVLIMKDKSPDKRDKLIWKWIKGDPTDQADFGVPTGTTETSLCIYTGTADALAADYRVPGSGVKWAPISSKGYKYKDASGAEDGITKVILKGSMQSKSKCLVKGKGDGLDDLDLKDLDDNGLVIVQLVNDATSACFESAFVPADFITFNDPMQFKAKAQ
jgi:cysteine-rich repeat protein